jgi:pimeloyl-ACP methyl ester carboxylesterase
VLSEQIHTLPDGRRLAYAEYGAPAGTPVFFFQGTPSSRLMHPDEDVTRDLGVRLIMADRPGFGLSDPKPGRTLLDWPDDVVALADALGIDRFGAVGVSGGGPYTAACAYRIPHRLTAAAIVGGSGPVDMPGTLAGSARERHIGYVVARHAPWLLRLVIAAGAQPAAQPLPVSGAVRSRRRGSRSRHHGAAGDARDVRAQLR